MTTVIAKTRKWFNRLFLIVTTKVLWLLSRIVPYRIGVRAGGCLGFTAYYFLARGRKRAIENLSSVFTDKDDRWIRRTARDSYVHLGKAMLEFMLMRPSLLDKMFTLRGFENLQQAHDQGRGVIYVTGHIGSWEATGVALAADFPLSGVAAPIEPKAVNDMILRLRSGLGGTAILRGRAGAARELIRVFKENRILAILIDQDTDVEGAFVDFMGRPAWTPTAAAQMAIRFNAPVVFGYTHRGDDNRHTITVEGPIDLVRTGDDEKDIITNTALFTKKLEDAIMKHPEQWVWMHRRWRRQP